MRLEGVEILGNRPDVFVDRPLIVVEDDDATVRCLGNVIESLEGWATGESSITSDGHDMIVFTLQVSG